MAAVAGSVATTIGGSAAAATAVTGMMGSSVGAASMIAGFGYYGGRVTAEHMARRIGALAHSVAFLCFQPPVHPIDHPCVQPVNRPCVKMRSLCMAILPVEIKVLYMRHTTAQPQGVHAAKTVARLQHTTASTHQAAKGQLSLCGVQPL